MTTHKEQPMSTTIAEKHGLAHGAVFDSRTILKPGLVDIGMLLVIVKASDLVAAVLTHQIGYHTDSTGWATGTTKQWADTIGVSVATTRRSIGWLVTAGWIESEERSGSYSRVRSFRLNHETIDAALNAASTR